MNPTFAISFAGVSKRFARPGGGILDALDRVSFDVPAGEIVAILGPSGSGKTTLLNFAAGLAAPDEGHVAVMGRDTGDAVDWSRVGYMFQDDRLLPWRVALRDARLALAAGVLAVPAGRGRGRGRGGPAKSPPRSATVLSRAAPLLVSPAPSRGGKRRFSGRSEPRSRLDAQTR